MRAPINPARLDLALEFSAQRSGVVALVQGLFPFAGPGVKDVEVGAGIHTERQQRLALVHPSQKIIAPTGLLTGTEIARQHKVGYRHIVDQVVLGLYCIAHLKQVINLAPPIHRMTALHQQIAHRVKRVFHFVD